jgi:hypothetical protein
MIQRWLVGMAVLCLGAAAQSQPLVDLAKESFGGATAEAGGQKLELDLGTKRVNWNKAKWSVLSFAQPKDLSAGGGIKLVVATDKPRSDAGVYLAIREEGGTWYYHPWAANLTQAQNAGVARFEDFVTPDWCNPPEGKFVDTNGALDLDKITAIAIGCVNPFGVGKVSFTIKEISLAPAAKVEAAAIKVEVTGKLIDINGTTAIPAGLFGGFNMPTNAHKDYRLAMSRQGWGSFGKPSEDPVTHMMINCFGDRAAPSIMMKDADWKAKLEANATKSAEACKGTKGTHYVEWWNEPYLNWSNKNRINFAPEFFNIEEAREGAPVKLKVDGSDCPHLKWTQNYDAPLFQWVSPRYTDGGHDKWRRGKDAQGKLSTSLFEPLPWNRGLAGWRASMLNCPPMDVKDGQTYTVTSKDAKTGAEKSAEYTAMTPWYVHDETQFTYWSARGQGRFYNEPMLAAGKALKAANPAVVYIAGWGFRPSEDHWAGWELAYKPTIDIGHEVIDGICDHDYGSDALKMAANYEVVTAYGVSKYNKWLTSWNTETASSTDPQAYPGAAEADKMNAANPSKFTWTARKLLHTLMVCPDKARAFAWFGSRDNPGPSGFFSAKGEGVLFTMLKNLRGKLVQVKCDDPAVLAVASIDGTDAQNPRPADMPQRKEMVVVALNDHREKRQVNLALAPPAGMKFKEMTVRRPQFGADGTITVQEHTSEPGGVSALLGPREMIAVTFVAEGEEAAKPQVQRRQFFGSSVVADVKNDKPVTQTIALKADDLKAAKRAWLRVVVESLAEGEGVVRMNGKDLALPRAVTPDNVAWVRQLALDVADLKESNELIFRVASPDHAGYFLGMASIVTETD